MCDLVRGAFGARYTRAPHCFSAMPFCLCLPRVTARFDLQNRGELGTPPEPHTSGLDHCGSLDLPFSDPSLQSLPRDTCVLGNFAGGVELRIHRFLSTIA